MAAYIVTYDLNREVVRPPIVAKVKEFPWAKLSESSYAIRTNLTPQQVYAHFQPLLDANDNLYVVTLARPYWGQGPKAVNDWLDQNL